MKKTSEAAVKFVRTQRGYSLIEFAITMGLVALVAGGVFAAYKFRVAPAAWTSSKFDTFNSVMAAIETAKNSRGLIYPAQATAASFPTVTALAPYIGSSSTDVNNWTYQCVSGSGSTLNLVVIAPDAPNADALNMLKDRISSAVPNSTVTVDTVNMKVTTAIASVTCG